MKRENFYRRNPSDALAGMVGMSLEERGVYNTIIDLLYSTWRPVEDSRPFIANWCGCAVQKLNPILDRLITRRKLIRFEDGGAFYITNGRFEEERTEVRGPAKSRSGRGEGREKSPGVAEKSPGVAENLQVLGDRGEEKQSLTATEEKRVEEKRDSMANAIVADEPPTSGLFANGDGESRSPAKPADPVPVAFAEWNALASRLNLSIAEKLTDDRRKRLKSRLADGGLAGWRKALGGVEASSWCRGERGDFRANLDFVLVPKNFQKLVEGGYGQEHPVLASGGASKPAGKAKPPFPDADVRQAILDAKGEAWVVAWLDECKWRPAPRPAIVAPSQTVADRIKREVWLVISGLGLEIISERARA